MWRSNEMKTIAQRDIPDDVMFAAVFRRNRTRVYFESLCGHISMTY